MKRTLMLVGMMLFSVAAWAQGPGDYSLGGSIGYAKLDTHGGERVFDGTDGIYFDFDAAWRMGDSPIWLGVGVDSSFFWEENDGFIDGEPVHLDTEAFVLTLEPRATLVLVGHEQEGLFAAAYAGAGLVLLDSWTDIHSHHGWWGSSDDSLQAGFGLRPGLRVGYSAGLWSLGAEMSYLWGWMGGGAAGDRMEELRLGVYFRMSY